MSIRRVAVFVAVSLAVLLLAASAAMAQPKRVLIVVMDGMRADYAQRYNMTNVLWLEKHGAFFKNAYVGHMPSSTIMHNVMVSGLLPKHQGWPDEVLRDTTDVLGGGADGIYVVGDLDYGDLGKLVAAADYPKLGTYLQAASPDSVVACVGAKYYQVNSMLAGTNPTDTNCIGVFVGDGITPTVDDPLFFLGGKYKGPDGINVPDYIANDQFGRFYVNADGKNDYGTLTTPGAWINAVSGNKYVPGTTEGHLGGDNWAADAAIRITQNEDWSGLFVNLAGIDSSGHTWGGGGIDTIARYAWDPYSVYNQVHLPFIAKNADTQLGRIIGALKAQGQFEDTLIVLLADHGMQYSKRFFGNDYPDAYDYNWGYGNSVNDGDYYATGDPSTPPPPAIKKFQDAMGGNIAFSTQGPMISTWLTDFSMPEKLAAAKYMRTMPGVIATYVKSDDGTKYVLDKAKKARMTSAEYAWWKLRGRELVNSMACPGSADIVALLKNQSAYGALGDHGGAQKDCQRIPMVFYNPSLAQAVRTQPARLVDVMPTILRALDITPTKSMDGRAYALKLK